MYCLVCSGKSVCPSCCWACALLFSLGLKLADLSFWVAETSHSVGRFSLILYMKDLNFLMRGLQTLSVLLEAYRAQ